MDAGETVMIAVSTEAPSMAGTTATTAAKDWAAAVDAASSGHGSLRGAWSSESVTDELAVKSRGSSDRCDDDDYRHHAVGNDEAAGCRLKSVEVHPDITAQERQCRRAADVVILCQLGRQVMI